MPQSDWVVKTKLFELPKKALMGSAFAFLILLFVLGGFLLANTVETATPPTIISYQGKLLESGASVTTTKSMAFLLYDASSGGTLLYTAGGTLVSTSTVSVSPSQGIFSVDLGAGITNSIDSSIFKNNASIYLEVWVDGTALSPRKQITAAPFALNSKYLMGYEVSTASSSVYIPLSDANGNFTFSGDPQSSGVSGGLVYINPATAGANETLFGIALNGAEKFRVDEDGDASLAGSMEVGTSTNSLVLLKVISNDTAGLTLQAESGGGATFRVQNGSNNVGFQIIQLDDFTAGQIGTSGQGGTFSVLDNSGVTTVNLSGPGSSYINQNLFIGTTGSEAISTSTFALDGNDMYVADMLGVGNAVFIENDLYIGTSTLHLNGGVDGGVISMSGGALTIDAASTLSLNTTNNQNVVIGTGNFGIGTSTPNYALTVSGTAYISGTTILNSGLTIGSDLAMGGNDITGTDQIIGNSTYITIGDAGSSSRAFTTNDDLFVSGRLEVDGNSFFDGRLSTSDLFMLDDGNITFGGSSDSFLDWSTNEATAETLIWALGTNSQSIVFTKVGNQTKSFDHGNQTNPTIFIHSATDPDSDNTQWLSLTHDQTNGVISTGAGDINLMSATGFVGINTTTPAYNLTVSGTAYISGALTTGSGLTLGSDLALAGNDITGVDQIIGNSTVITIGDAGSTSHTLNANDDLFVSGKLEVDGLSYFDSNVNISGKIALDGTQVLYRPTDMTGTLVLGDGGTNLSHTTGIEGYYNTFVGIGSGIANTTGSNNTANGYASLYSNTSGSYNSSFGTNAGRYITGGSIANATSTNSLYLGYNTKAFASGDTNEIIIGYEATGNGSNSVTLGNDSITKTILKGNVGINTTTPGYGLTVSGTTYISGASTFAGQTLTKGNVLNPTIVNTFQPGGSNGDLDGISKVRISGNYAYAGAGIKDQLVIINIADPTSPTTTAIFQPGGLNGDLDNISDVAIANNYAYALSYDKDQLVIIDITNPASPTTTAIFQPGGLNGDLNGARMIKIIGNYAYIASLLGGKMTIIDISDPYNPFLVSTFNASGTLTNMFGLDVVGNYAYLTTSVNDKMVIADISDPYNPSLVSNYQPNGVGGDLDGTRDVRVVGNYAYLTAFSNSSIAVVDVSNPESPTTISIFKPGTADLYSPEHIEISGNYAYVSTYSNAALKIIDITDKSNLSIVSSLSVSGPSGLALKGNYVYQAAGSSDSLLIIDITGATISNTEIGTAQIDNLQVFSTSRFENGVDIKGGLSIGRSGLLLNGDFGMSNGTNSSTLTFASSTLFTSNLTDAGASDTAFTFNTSNSFGTSNLFKITEAGSDVLVIDDEGRMALYDPNGNTQVILDPDNGGVKASLSMGGNGLYGVLGMSDESGNGLIYFAATTSVDSYISSNFLVGAAGESIADANFVMNGQDFYVHDKLGVNGESYFDNNINIVGDILGVDQIIGNSTVVTIGDAGTTSAGLTANDDLFVSGKLETDGVIYADGDVYFTNSSNYGARFQAGANDYAEFNTVADGGFVLGLAGTNNIDNNNFIIANAAYRTNSFGHTTLSSNPTIFIHSATDPNSDNTQWLSLTHDQTNGRITTGKGYLVLDSALGAISMYDQVLMNFKPIYFGASVANPGLYGANAAGLYKSLNIIAGGNDYGISVVANANKTNDYSVGTTTNTHFRVYSATAAATSKTQYIEMYHDQTDGVISTGAGDLNLTPATNKLALNGTTIAFVSSTLTGTLVLGDGGSALSHTTGITGYYNTFVGLNSGVANTTGFYNTATGYDTLATNIVGNENTAFGTAALWKTTGNANTAVGSSALQNSTTGDNNTVIGAYAIMSNTTGGNNTAVGYGAGRYITGGSIANATSTNSLYLGYNTKAFASGDTNEIVIGYDATGNGSNSITLGNSSITKTVLNGTISYTSGSLSGPAHIFDTDTAFTSAGQYLFSIRTGGTAKFSVEGDGTVRAAGQLFASSATVGTPGAPGDLAERVDINPAMVVEAGDVLVVDSSSNDMYAKSQGSYIQEVAGVVSTNPTITVGNGKTQHTAVMAMVGRVPIKVSAENGQIERGDLLITASIPGYAMKYDPTKDTGDNVVGIVGIALDSLPTSTGKIMGLIKTGWVNNKSQTIAQIQQDLISVAQDGAINIQADPTQLTVVPSGSGSILPIASDLNLNNFSIINVRSLMAANNSWGVDQDGRFITKVSTTEGDKNLYALQSQDTELIYSGSGTLINGEFQVFFSNVESEIIDVNKPIKVSVTLTAEANGIFVSQKDNRGFTVKELQSGASNATFDWVVIASRRIGPAPVVVEPIPEPIVPTSTPTTTPEIVVETPTSTSEIVVETTTTTPTVVEPAPEPIPDPVVVIEPVLDPVLVP